MASSRFSAPLPAASTTITPLLAGVADRGEVVRPPLDGDEAVLVVAHRKLSGARPVQLDEDDVPGVEQVGGRRIAPAEPVPPKIEMARTLASGEMPVTPKALHVAADLAHHRGAVVAPGRVVGRGPADHAALVLVRSSWVKRQRAFDVDDADAGAAALRLGPGVACVDAARSRRSGSPGGR